MNSDYPWYELVAEPTYDLEQGDLIYHCPVLVPEELPQLESIASGGSVRMEVLSADLIVISQTCDLAQDKLNQVVLCAHSSLSEIEHSLAIAKKKGRERIRQGTLPGYLMLDACDAEGFEQEIRVVDFRQVYTLPVKFVRTIAFRQGKRLRLLPPYREYLAQGFAKFFMRVGLPRDIPPFS